MNFHQPLVANRSTVGLTVRRRFSSLQSVGSVVTVSFVFGCTVLITCAGFGFSSSTAFAQSAVSEKSSEADKLNAWQSSGLPLMQAYCVDCHNEDLQEGDLDLSPFETLDDLSESQVKRVIEMVRFGAMPPEDYDVPNTSERKQLVAALESVIFSTDCDLMPRSGRVTVRRLNRNEYDNSVRDLFGIDIGAARAFPSDEVGAGFDNNSDVLSLSPMLIEKYIQAAESISKQVIIDPSDLPQLNWDVAPDQIPVYGEPKVGRFNGRFLDVDSFAWLDIDVPFDGRYRITVRGGVTEKDAKPMMVSICDGAGKLLAKDDLKYFGGSGSSDRMSETVELTKGRHRLAFVPVFDRRDLQVGETVFEFVAEMDPDRAKEILAALSKPVPPNRRIDSDDYPFMFRSFEIDGPERHPQEAFPPKQFQIVRERPPRRRDGYRDVRQTAAKNLRPLMRLAFRGPVSDEEVDAYAALAERSTKESESFYRGMQIAISALLVSPRFLFRVETPEEGTKPNEFGDLPLSPHQLASRLSYFIWSSTPDETLLKQAAENRLGPKELRDQVRRMLADPKADAMSANFAAQWLGLRNLTEHEADIEKFPEFDDDLKDAMSKETELLFLHLLRNNRSVREFLTADYSFLNLDLAQHYGIDLDREQASEGAFTKVSLTSTPRRGLLAHASILTLTSTPTRTSPVLRGKWILENVLGAKAPEPPSGVPDLDETKAAAESASLRKQLELHRESPNCASCHRVMDQLGFGLDDFDAVGRYRTEDAGKPIDSSGALPDGRSFRGGAQLSKMLGQTETDAFARTVIERMLTFAIGRELTPGDRCTIDEIFDNTQPGGFRLGDIVAEIATCRQFRFQAADQPSGPSTSGPSNDEKNEDEVSK